MIAPTVSCTHLYSTGPPVAAARHGSNARMARRECVTASVGTQQEAYRSRAGCDRGPRL